MSKGLYVYRDWSKEISSFELNFADIAAGGANFDAVKAAVVDMGDAVLACTVCVDASEGLKQETAVPDPSVPADEDAQREVGMRVFYADDTTGKVNHFTIPGPDKSACALIIESDLFDPTDEPLASLITELESSVLSPVGNAVSFLRAVQVGRNN